MNEHELAEIREMIEGLRKAGKTATVPARMVGDAMVRLLDDYDRQRRHYCHLATLAVTAENRIRTVREDAERMSKMPVRGGYDLD